MSSAKQQITEIVQEQPDDSTYDAILPELAFARMIERGLEDSEAKRTISDDDMKQKIKTWRKQAGWLKQNGGSEISTTT
jgi:hypothetical protein